MNLVQRSLVLESTLSFDVSLSLLLFLSTGWGGEMNSAYEMVFEVWSVLFFIHIVAFVPITDGAGARACMEGGLQGPQG